MIRIAMGVVCAMGILATAQAAVDVPKTLKKMEGCFEVKFNYVRQDAAPYNEKLAEYTVVEEKGGKIRVRRYANFFRHWKELWTQGKGDSWNQVVLDPDGKTKRYECDGEFTEYAERSGGKGGAFRRCEAKGALAPRRYVRSNPAVQTLDRVSRVLITDGFWNDYQANDVRGAKGALLFDEVGLNHYRKLAADTDCEAAKKLADDDEDKDF